MKPNDATRLAERFAGLSRRHFLKGLGACLAVPAFESLAPLSSFAGPSTGRIATTATGAPLRSAFLYFPNGAIPSAWWPKTEGKDFELSPTLEPLAPCKQSIQVLAGLDHRNAEAGPDGAGDHARASGTFLTGVRVKKSAADVRAATSIDQLMAREIGHVTRFPSIELTCDFGRKSGSCDSGYSCAYQYNMSWSSPTTPVSPEHNPRLVFERLFGSGSPAERAENLRRRQAEQRSLLDFVMDDARSMEKRLQARDRDKLDQYLTGVREIETRIEKAEKFGKIQEPHAEAPPGIPAEYADYLQLMFDMLVLAFQTDSTRVATLLLAHDGSNRSFADIGISEGHHDLSHHFDDPVKIKKVQQIDHWYVEQFSKFLQKLDAIKDVDGNSLLHNSMILYGGGNADGNRHTHTNLSLILAGSGGGTLSTGRFVKHGGKPTCNLFLTMADNMGITKLERFGDSTARLTGV